MIYRHTRTCIGIYTRIYCYEKGDSCQNFLATDTVRILKNADVTFDVAIAVTAEYVVYSVHHIDIGYAQGVRVD